MEQGPPTSPWSYIFFGAAVSAVGGFVFASMPSYGDNTPQLIVALVLLWLGSVLSLAGTVGLGVLAGNLRSDWVRRMEKLEQQAKPTD